MTLIQILHKPYPPSLLLLYWLILINALINTACTSINNKVNADSNINVNLGMAYLEQNKPQPAKYRLLLALQQAPRNEFAQSAFAYYLEKTGELNQAEQHYLFAIRFANHTGAAQNNYGAF